MDEEKKQAHFIKEKIVKRPLSPREKGKRFLMFALAALFFGTVAGASFAVANHVVKSGFKEEERETQTFTIPGDESQSDETESEPESEEETKAPPASEAAPESWEQWQKELEKEISGSLVTIQIKTKGADSFADSLEKEREYSGAIIGESEKEYLVLCPWSPLSEAESISVRFYNGSWAKAQVKGKDTTTDIAVLSVQVEEQNPVFGTELPKPLSLGNSYQVVKGNRVLAVGSPYGFLNGPASGSIIGTDEEEAIDSRIQVLYSNIGASSEGLGFLLDQEGRLIGLLTGQYSGMSDSILTASIGISDLKQILTNLGQGNEIAYLGLRMQVISKADSSQRGLPGGLYVTEVLQESPAYEAGIQAGDIVTAIDGEELETIKEFQSSLLSRKPGDKVVIAVLRSGKNGYSTIEYPAVLGSR